MRELVGLLAGLVVTLVATKPLVVLLRHKQVLDVPNARSSHADVTPRGGGIAVMLGLSAGLVAGGASTELWGVFLGVVAAAMVGFVDDVRGVSAVMRLALQALLAAALGWWLLCGTDVSPWAMAALFTLCVVWLIGYVNAFNFMDGINGISAVSAAAGGVWYLCLGLSSHLEALAVGGAALAGAALGFLPWNAPRAQVFLGDVGSYGLGMALGSLAVVAAVAGNAPLAVTAPLLVYLADTSWTLLLRVRRGESWRDAHRDHVYQRLCDLGWSHVAVAGLVLAVTVVVCVVVWWTPPFIAAVVCVGVLVGYLATPHVLARTAGAAEADPSRRQR